MKDKVKFERIDKDLPFFKDTMPEDHVPSKPCERQKETADKICKWLFSENDNEPIPKEVLGFIGFMKMIHTNV